MIYVRIKRTDTSYEGQNARRCAEVIKMICKGEVSICRHVDSILEKKDKNSLASSLCAFECLLELCAEQGIAPSSLKIGKEELGRPYFTSHGELDFNVSHTRDYVAVALATDMGERVGIDVENADRFALRSDSDIEKLANRFFCGRELREFSDGDSPSSKFIELWTRKEAYLKYTGDGIGKMSVTDTFSPLPENVSFLTDSIGVLCTDAYFTLCYSGTSLPPSIKCEI